jgi:preprotein translocase subunit SecB
MNNETMTAPSEVLPDAPGAYILDQYLADFSIENPGGRIPAARAVDLVLGLDVAVVAAPLIDAPEGSYAIQIALGMPARLDDQIIFLIELRYRVNVQLQGVSAEKLPNLLSVQVPHAVFPTLKAIVEQNGAFAGYPDIVLQPIDFSALVATKLQA